MLLKPMSEEVCGWLCRMVLLLGSVLLVAGCQDRRGQKHQSDSHRNASSSHAGGNAIDWAKLRDPDPKVREQACSELLHDSDAPGPERIDALVTMLRDSDDDVQGEAETCLLNLDSEPSRGPALAAALQSSDDRQRFGAAEAIGRIGSDNRFFGGDPNPPVAQLKRLLADPSERVQVAAAWALTRLEVDVSAGLVVIDSALDSQDRKILNLAFDSIAEYSSGFDPEHRAEFFKKERPETLMPKLLAMVSDQSLRTHDRARIADWLGICGDTSEPVISVLTTALCDPSEDVQLAAAYSFSDLRYPKTPLSALQILCDHLDDDEKAHSGMEIANICRAFEHLDQFPPFVIETLTRHLGEPEKQDRFFIACVLSHAPGKPPATAEKVLVDEFRATGSLYVLEALGRIAPRSEAAREALNDATHDKRVEVREAAERILKAAHH